MTFLSGLLGLGRSEPLPALADERTPANPTSCIFCKASPETGFKIAYEDELFLAFEDRKPDSAVHYLVIPRKHVGSVRTLKSKDVELIKSMEKVGHTVLDKFDVPSDSRRMGFHVPPFNSIGALSFLVSSGFAGFEKGFSWFVEVNQATRILERGGRVGVGPS